MNRAGTIAVLALSLWGCRPSPPELSCMVDSYGPWRFCLRKCPEGYRCFQRKEAHCFRNGPGPLLCTPTAEECSALRVSNKAEEACRLTPADEL